ncbi:MAG: chemotaxis protein CheA [Deltaproteobacteria bacterium]|nr:chemotaxis protein CheA [Deltaproteobacteria bacterium]
MPGQANIISHEDQALADSYEEIIRQTFLEEAEQSLADIEQCIIEIDRYSSRKKIYPSEISSNFANLFRLVHNLKGSSAGVGFSKVSDLSHILETFLTTIKNENFQISGETCDFILECNDFFRKMIVKISQNPDSQFDLKYFDNKAEQQLSSMKTNIPSDNKTEQKKEPVAEITEQKKEPVAEITEQKKESVTEIAEQKKEPVTEIYNDNKLSGEQTVMTEPSSSTAPVQEREQLTKDESIRVRMYQIEQLNNYVGEMVVMQTVLNQQKTELNQELLSKVIPQMDKTVKEIQNLSLGLRMIPISQLFTKIQRVCRDTSRAVGKEVELTLEGEQTEVDKTIIEKISDPLVHMVRNSIDHGLESKEERLRIGKEPIGHVTLRCYHDGGHVIIEVSDDGAGLNKKLIEEKAIKNKLIPENHNLREDDILNLIFHGGFSTKDTATDVSGRGVGMDVVLTNIQSLSGEIDIATHPGKGSTFKISVPLSLAVIDGVVANVNTNRYILPMSQVFESVKISPEDLDKASGVGTIFNLRGKNIPVIFAHEILSEKSSSKEFYTAVIIRKHGFEPYAVLVDEILKQQQIVVKPISKALKFTRSLIGTAILGDGLPAFIIDLFDVSQYVKGLAKS